MTKRIDLPMREIYELRLEGKTYKELANIYGCSTSTIRRRVKEFKQRKTRMEEVLKDANHALKEKSRGRNNFEEEKKLAVTKLRADKVKSDTIDTSQIRGINPDHLIPNVQDVDYHRENRRESWVTRLWKKLSGRR